jgi:hypothetical protein
MEAQNNLVQGLQTLEKFEDMKLNGQRVQAQICWRDHGDSWQKEFFRIVKP